VLLVNSRIGPVPGSVLRGRRRCSVVAEASRKLRFPLDVALALAKQLIGGVHERTVGGGLPHFDWQAAIRAEQRLDGAHPSAHTFIRKWPSASQPVAVQCDDGSAYVLKGRQLANPQMPWIMTAEQCVARLGGLLLAPVPRVEFVELPQALIDAEPQLSHMIAGTTHGSKMIPNCSERINAIGHAITPRNRDAYAKLAVLYGIAMAGDKQLIATLDAAGDVYSVDHGHFFPNGPNWNAGTLGARDVALPDQDIVALGADAATVVKAATDARGISDQQIASAVGCSHSSWDVPMGDLIALAEFLAHRRSTL
jgi:hypothetical protein